MTYATAECESNGHVTWVNQATQTKHCEDCAKKRRSEAQKRHRKKLRARFIQLYGTKCCCCREEDDKHVMTIYPKLPWTLNPGQAQLSFLINHTEEGYRRMCISCYRAGCKGNGNCYA